MFQAYSVPDVDAVIVSQSRYVLCELYFFREESHLICFHCVQI